MYAEISMARVATAPDAASGLDCTMFEIELLYPKYDSQSDDAPTLTPTGAGNVECIWTWPETSTVDTLLVVGRLAHGDWVVIAEAC